MTVPLAKRLRRGLRSLLLRGLVRALSRVPRRAGMAMASLAARLAWWLAPGTRRLMLAHLEIAFPELRPDERRAIGRGCLLHLGWLAAEMLTIRSYAGEVEEYVSFVPGALDTLRAAMAEGRGLVMVSGHIGHWELVARRLVLAGIPCVAVAKAGSDPKLDALLGRFRAEGDIEVLHRDAPGTSRRMISCFRQGKLLGMLIDQDTRVQGVFVPFFGRDAWTPRAAGDLATRFQAPVAVIWSRRRGPLAGDGHELSVERVPYEVGAADREATSVGITRACTAILERAIRERPAEWVWMHRRWRRRPAEPVR